MAAAHRTVGGMRAALFLALVCIVACRSADPVTPPSERATVDVILRIQGAERLLAQGDAEAALARLREIVELAPSYYVGLRAEQDALLALGRDEEALELARTRAERGADPIAWVLLARLQSDVDAEASLERAIDVDPQCHHAHYALGVVAARAARYEDAERSFSRALDVWPRLHVARRARAEIRDQLADFTGSASDYEAYLDDEPWDQDARYNLASILHRELARPADAERHYRLLLDQNPDNVVAMVGLAVRLMERGDPGFDDFAVAEQLLQRASNREPTALFDLGVLYQEKLDRPELALQSFERFLALESPAQDVRTVADRLFYAPLRIESLRRELGLPAEGGAPP